MFQTVPLSIIRSFSLYTQQQWYMSYWFADSSRAGSGRKLSANLYDIHYCCVYSEKLPDDGQRNCLKHVEFYSKNKFEKLVHIVGFITRIYHDVLSPECQILNGCFNILSSSLFLFDTSCQTMKPFTIWSSFQITFQRPKIIQIHKHAVSVYYIPCRLPNCYNAVILVYYLLTVKSNCIYSQTFVHECLGSRTIRFTKKFSEHKASRMTYSVSIYEHASRQIIDKNKSHWTSF